MSNGRRGLTERRVARPQSTPFPQDHRLRVAAENMSGPPGTSEAPSKLPRGGEVTNPPRGGLSSVHHIATPRPPLRGNPSARTAFPVGGGNRTRLPPARGTGPRVTAEGDRRGHGPEPAQPSRSTALSHTCVSPAFRSWVLFKAAPLETGRVHVGHHLPPADKLLFSREMSLFKCLP